MTPQQPFSEEQFWSDFHIIRNDVNAAIVSCYTQRAINDAEVNDVQILQRMNRCPEYWRITTFSLQSTLFIVLHRILDSDSTVHSIHKVLNAVIAHPEMFNKASWRARRFRTPGEDPNPPWLNEYLKNAWEPTIAELREFKRALRPHKQKFDEIYRPVRHHIAHITLKDEQAIAALYSRTRKSDIDEILCFLHNLVHAIQDLGNNARRQDLASDRYNYAGRVAEITQQTSRFLSSF